MSIISLFFHGELLIAIHRYTRSTNAERGKKSVVLETKHDISQEYSKSILASQEGTYEVVSIRDRYCGFTTQRVVGKKGQLLLTFR